MRVLSRWLVVLALGLLVAGCGSVSVRQARCAVAVPGDDPSMAFGAVLAAELPDGTLVVGGSRNHGRTLLIRLRRLTQDCRPVASFGDNGTATIVVKSVQPEYVGIARMVTTPGGELLLAGTDGHSELVGRLLASGRLDHSFGNGGWTRISPHGTPLGPTLPAPIATSLALTPAGAIFVGGNDQEAHCCVQDFVSELSPQGNLVRSFGHEGSVVLPAEFVGSFTTDVYSDAVGGVYALGLRVFMGCGGPIVVRVRSDGSLDARFDAAAARSIASATPHRLLFVPALILRPQPGSFALIGGLSNECGTASHVVNSGLAVGLLPSGRIDRSYGRDGTTRFPGNVDPFSTSDTSLLETRSGRILALTSLYSASAAAVVSATVRAFSTSGAIDQSFGKSGARIVDLRTLPRTEDVNVALAPGRDGGAWVVTGFPKEINLIRVQP